MWTKTNKNNNSKTGWSFPLSSVKWKLTCFEEVHPEYWTLPSIHMIALWTTFFLLLLMLPSKWFILIHGQILGLVYWLEQTNQKVYKHAANTNLNIGFHFRLLTHLSMQAVSCFIKVNTFVCVISPIWSKYQRVSKEETPPQPIPSSVKQFNNL